MTISRVHEFVGANIKGWPAMSGAKVHEDLRTLQARADLIVLQEFRWPRYWQVLSKALDREDWGATPHRRTGLARSTYAAQTNLWLRDEWVFERSSEALLHE